MFYLNRCNNYSCKGNCAYGLQWYFFFVDGNIDDKFSIAEGTGELSCKPLDREAAPAYNLTILAKDSGSPSLQSTAKLYIRVPKIYSLSSKYEKFIIILSFVNII